MRRSKDYTRQKRMTTTTMVTHAVEYQRRRCEHSLAQKRRASHKAYMFVCFTQKESKRANTTPEPMDGDTRHSMNTYACITEAPKHIHSGTCRCIDADAHHVLFLVRVAGQTQGWHQIRSGTSTQRVERAVTVTISLVEPAPRNELDCCAGTSP